MFTLRKWLSTASVDNHFRRVNILTITLSGMYYLFYYTEITIRQETLRAGEEDAAF